MKSLKNTKNALTLVTLSAVLVSLVSQSAGASCIPAYQERIHDLSGRMIGARTGLVTSSASGAIAAAAIIAATGAMTVAGAVAAPAAALAAGGYLAEMAIERAEYRKAMHLIQGSRDRVVNAELEDLFKTLEKKGFAFDIIEMMDQIRDADDQGLFCPVNPYTDRSKLGFPGAIKRYLIQTRS